uniref:Uncharacterized protein n=1 Tax=Anguilla anguilla TaxID=7936 RepID=A0A0E9V4H3_ANGAN
MFFFKETVKCDSTFSAQYSSTFSACDSIVIKNPPPQSLSSFI